MKRRIPLLTLGIMATIITAFSQVITLSSGEITSKNAAGKNFTDKVRSEKSEQTFSHLQNPVDGKKRFASLPSVNDESPARNLLPENSISNLINKPLAHFRFPGLYFQVWDSKQLKGRVLVMNFWDTKCTSCSREIPHLNELAEEYKYMNVIFLALAPEKPFRIHKFLKKNSFRYNIIPAAKKYTHQLKIEKYPVHFVIDKKGIIRDVFTGYTGNIKEKLQAAIERQLKER